MTDPNATNRSGLSDSPTFKLELDDFLEQTRQRLRLLSSLLERCESAPSARAHEEPPVDEPISEAAPAHEGPAADQFSPKERLRDALAARPEETSGPATRQPNHTQATTARPSPSSSAPPPVQPAPVQPTPAAPAAVSPSPAAVSSGPTPVSPGPAPVSPGPAPVSPGPASRPLVDTPSTRAALDSNEPNTGDDAMDRLNAIKMRLAKQIENT